MALNTGTVTLFRSFAFFSDFFTHKNCGLIVCFAKPLTKKCSAKILRLKVAKLRLNFGIVSQNCDWMVSQDPEFFFLASTFIPYQPNSTLSPKYLSFL